MVGIVARRPVGTLLVMLVYAGIDEAGYGPTLGPLCVGCTVFVLENHDPAAGAPHLWKTLAKAVCRKRTDKRKRIAVDDSKNLKGTKSSTTTHPLKHLERAVLAFGFEAGLPACDSEFFQRIDAVADAHDWYATSTPLPVGQRADELRIAASRLARTMRETGVRCELIRCDAIDAAEFNRQVAKTNNKAAINMAAALRHVDRIWSRWPQQHPRIIIDRHGGRIHYREELQFAWPEAHIQILAEDERMSRYRLDCGGSQATVTFMPEAETSHLPVALASMAAKYTRELFMLRMNRYFAQHIPELKPTAGYFTDAQRYLNDIAPAIKQLNINHENLIRAL